MTTDEIKTLIAQTIQGQGDAVDVGGGLAKILTSLAEAAPKVVYLDDIQFDDSGKATLTLEQYDDIRAAQGLVYDGSKFWTIGIIPSGLENSLKGEYNVSTDGLWGFIKYVSDDFSIDSAEAFMLGYSGGNPYLIKMQI